MARARRTCSDCPAVIDHPGRCDKCAKKKRQASDIARGSSTERGYNSRGHKTFRRLVIARDPICVICRKAWATVADHHPLSRKQLIDAGLNPDDPNAGRGLCKPCHDRETATNQPGGWAIHAKRPTNRNALVIAGPPCAGKNTYIERHRQPGDVLIDYDEIMAERTGLPLHQHDPAWAERVQSEYDQRVAMLLDSEHHGWIITASPFAARRHRFHVEVRLLVPSMQVALERAASHRPAEWQDRIRDWYRRYEPDARDVVVRE